MKIEDIVNAVASEKSLLRAMGSSAHFFSIEVHLSEALIAYLKSTAYVNISEDKPLTFMGCPVIKDKENFVCTIHRTDFDQEGNK